MHDIRAIRDNPAAFDAALSKRGLAPMSEDLLKLDEGRRLEMQAIEETSAEANSFAKLAGKAKATGNDDEFKRLLSLSTKQKQNKILLTDNSQKLDKLLTARLAEIPNLPAKDVPVGTDENDNVEVSKWGTPRSIENALEHFDIAAVKHGMDFETAAKISGSRFVLLKGSIARLHRALAQFMLDVHTTENGLLEMNTPVLVRDEAMYGTDKLPKFAEDSYQTTEGNWLISTSEIPLTYIAAGEVMDASDLPRRYAAHTLCFRSEAGSAGRDTSGMLRQHQFEKVEMVSVTHPGESDAEQKRMLRCAEDLLERLEIPYRTVLLCTGDMGFGARRTFDIEAWLPGQNTYREISSVSTTGDFQARRMNARFKPADGGKPQFVHTLNGSGLAVGRCLIAVLENGQQPDGSVTIPAALHGHMGGKTTINADGTLG